MKFTTPLIAIALLIPSAQTSFAATYYVSADGADDGAGTSPQAAWRSVKRVNAADLKPGDTVLFRRGDRWRGTLVTKSGEEGRPVTYAAYGDAEAKPLLVCCLEKNSPADWHDQGDNLWATAPGSFSRDVGNIIFDREASCGVKVWERSHLKKQGQYWYDEREKLVVLYSADNPAEIYSDVNCVLREHVITLYGVHHVVCENLAVKYGAAHGFQGANCHHVTVRNCDVAYIGGGDQRGGDTTTRFGNGVEFWAGAHDCLVEGCRLWEIYDAALTNQSLDEKTLHYNIRYRNNVIWNCEYSFEYWNRPENSSTHDIYFENNTCINAGGGWGHSQRPDPGGRHLCFYSSTAPARDIFIRNNIFHQATDNSIYFSQWTDEAIRGLKMSGNLWNQAQGTMVRIIRKDGAKEYDMRRFEEFEKDYGQGQK